MKFKPTVVVNSMPEFAIVATLIYSFKGSGYRLSTSQKSCGHEHDQKALIATRKRFTKERVQMETMACQQDAPVCIITLMA
jgi:hypothetical protein